MQPPSTHPLLSEEDYGAIEAAVMETARGRWFLAEYARRNRNADTDTVLAAIRRLEGMVDGAGAFAARDEVTRGMADIAHAIAAVEIEPVASQPEQSNDAVEKPLPVVEGSEAPAEEVALGEAVIDATLDISPTPEQFPIIELDEEAASALLTQDAPRQGLILPANHLVARYWNKRDATPATEKEPLPNLQPAPSLHEPTEDTDASGLVTFIDEEPVDTNESVFSAPLRLEPEDDPAEEEAGSLVPAPAEAAPLDALPPASVPRRPAPVFRMTVSDIESMPFAKKAALFS